MVYLSIDLDSNGYPNGILKERACELIFKLMGNKSSKEKTKFISEGLNICLKMGLTSVQTNDECALAVYSSLQAEDLLPIRVFLTPNISDLGI
jgi:predicted amidohydrolase YtcJ